MSNNARNIARQFAGQDLIAVEPNHVEPKSSAEFGAVAVPEDIVALARAGKTLEAVKRYRALNGATLEEAQAVIRDVT